MEDSLTAFVPFEKRYDGMRYNRCGRSGLKLPAISLGLWHNFGGVDVFETARTMVRHAFDRGITHFDLANNYGPPPGSADGAAVPGKSRQVCRPSLFSTWIMSTVCFSPSTSRRCRMSMAKACASASRLASLPRWAGFCRPNCTRAGNGPDRF